MQTDPVELYIYKGGFSGTGYRITAFNSYSVDVDIFQAAGAWSFECYDPGLKARAGMGVRLFVNGVPEMTGIIDKIEPSYSKTSHVYKVSGRDMLGLLVGHCCETYGAYAIYNGVTIQAMTQLLVKNIPYLGLQDVSMGSLGSLDTPFNFGSINPGETVFEVLKRFATARGILFYAAPNGTIQFTVPAASGKASFTMQHQLPWQPLNNVIEGSLVDDITKAYSKTTLIGQIQQQVAIEDLEMPGNSFDIAEPVNVSATATLPAGILPEGFYKPLVKPFSTMSVSPSALAKLDVTHQRAKAFRLTYTVPGHSQNSRNWSVNALCKVVDDALFYGQYGDTPINGTYLITKRTFTRSKKEGSRTQIELGFPRVMSDE